MAGTGTASPIDLQRYLSGVDHLASKQDLVRRAHQEGAPDEVAGTIERLPAEEFDSPAAISKALGRLRD